jgi:ankyrin repeat protein
MEGKTSLILAARSNSAKAIKAILRIVNNPDKLASMQDIRGNTALIEAAEDNSVESIKAILHNVNNPEALVCITNAYGMTAMMHAAGFFEPDSLIAILDNVNNVNQLAFMKNKDDYNALMLAADLGRYRSINVLLDRVKNPTELIYFANDDGKTALMLACHEKWEDESVYDFKVDTINAILKREKKVRDPSQQISPTYSKRKNSYIPLDNDSLIFMKDSEGMNAFMFAMQSNFGSAALELLNWTSDKLSLFTENNIKQLTALDLISEEWYEEICDELIENLENLDISDDSQNINDALSLIENHIPTFLKIEL